MPSKSNAKRIWKPDLLLICSNISSNGEALKFSLFCTSPTQILKCLFNFDFRITRFSVQHGKNEDNLAEIGEICSKNYYINSNVCFSIFARVFYNCRKRGLWVIRVLVQWNSRRKWVWIPSTFSTKWQWWRSDRNVYSSINEVRWPARLLARQSAKFPGWSWMQFWASIWQCRSLFALWKLQRVISYCVM